MIAMLLRLEVSCGKLGTFEAFFDDFPPLNPSNQRFLSPYGWSIPSPVHSRSPMINLSHRSQV